MDTSRLNEVKAPQHRRTPRSHSLCKANNASFLSPQSLSGPVSSKLPRATSSATTWEQDMFIRL